MYTQQFFVLTISICSSIWNVGRCLDRTRLEMFKADDMIDLCNSCYIPGFHNWNKFLILSRSQLLNSILWTKVSGQNMRTRLVSLSQIATKLEVKLEHIDQAQWVSVWISFVLIYKIIQGHFEFNGCRQKILIIQLQFWTRISRNWCFFPPISQTRKWKKP